MKLLIVAPGLCIALSACDLTGPHDLPPDQFGAVTALVRGKPWISDPSPDSVIATYDSVTKRLTIGASNADQLGYYRGLALDVCDVLEVRQYAFAPTPNGPYGYAAFVLGVVGQWWEPAGNISKPPGESYALNSLLSHGETGDMFAIEELDFPRRRIRGSFRFRAYTLSGSFVKDIHGRFYGRLELRTLPCSVS